MYDTIPDMAKAINPEQEFYSLSQVAKKLGLSKMTVYRYVKSKKLSAYRFGRDYRVRSDDLDHFITQFKV